MGFVGGIARCFVDGGSAPVWQRPAFLASRIVRQGPWQTRKSSPTRSIRSARCDMPRARCQPRGDRNSLRQAPGRARRKPQVTLVEVFDYACPYCKASNPMLDRLLQEDKGLRVVYREFPILRAGQPGLLRGCRLRPASLDASRSSTTCSWGDRPAGTGHQRQSRRGGRNRGRAPSPIKSDRGRACAQHEGGRRAGATGTGLFVVGDRVMNGAVGYDAERCDREGSPEELNSPVRKAALSILL